VFGNALEDAAAVSTDAVRSNMGLITWDAAAKVYKSTMTSPGNTAFIASIDLANSDRTIAGFADSKQKLIATVNVSGSSTQVTTLTSQVAALTAEYNALAAKWNKRVASKTAPKKKVALK